MSAEQTPFFVVGCPRSGTTLTRLMLEEHPRLAIPPESPWLVELAPQGGRFGRDSQAQTLDAVVRHPDYAHWALPEEVARAAVARRRPSTYAELVAALYAAYAERQGKPRWGDKTASNVLHLERLAGLFPDAVFIHMIRDGRDVAASLTDQYWTTGGIAGKAYWWRDCVVAGRRAGRRLGPARYCEVRLEDLIADPEAVLRRVCAAIGESYTPRMLDYPERGAQLATWASKDGRTHQHLGKPPTAGLRDWQAGISPHERVEVIRICRPLLKELGYEPEGPSPTVSYLVCGTNRSGSNLLCGLLRSTGVAGRPEEWFWVGNEPQWADLWGASGPVEYVRAAVTEGTTPNGVCGAKVMWGQMPHLLDKLTHFQGQQGRSERELLELAFPKLQFIWIQREDVIAQAVSFWRALQTGEWVGDARRNGPEPQFDFARIQAFAKEAKEHNEAWRRWFAANGVEPFRVRYEDLVRDMEGVTRGVLAFLGLELPAGASIEPQHSRQADALNEEWAARYRQMVLCRSGSSSPVRP